MGVVCFPVSFFGRRQVLLGRFLHTFVHANEDGERKVRKKTPTGAKVIFAGLLKGAQRKRLFRNGVSLQGCKDEDLVSAGYRSA